MKTTKKYIKEKAFKKVQEKYDGQEIAKQTKQLYKAVLGEYPKKLLDIKRKMSVL